MKCAHKNIAVRIKQILYSEICDGGVHDGDPTVISYEIECPDCKLNTKYHKSQMPKWLIKYLKSVK